jgi:hypothetical protein
MERIGNSLTEWRSRTILARDRLKTRSVLDLRQSRGSMAKASANGKSAKGKRSPKGRGEDDAPPGLEGMLWRVDRLERQVQRLCELVREHAADADRLVQIVAEDHELLRQELLEKDPSTQRGKKLLRALNGKHRLLR